MKNENDKIAQAIRHLKKHYRGNILFLALFFLLVLFRLLPFFGMEQPVSVTLERYAIMIPIIAIPLSLKYFANRLKGVTRPAEATTAIKVYKSASYLRLYTLSTVMVCSCSSGRTTKRNSWPNGAGIRASALPMQW